MLYDLITNQVVVVPLGAWAVAQLLKTLLKLKKTKRFDLRYVVATGGMPSSHSAIVTALATTVAMVQGLGSVAFGITCVFALIVMYDSAGVRKAVGQQAVVLNRIVKEIRFRRPMAEVERDLRELVGHTPLQVVAGASLGIVISWLWLIL